MGVEIVSLVDEGLGHSGHLVAIDGAVLVIDPLRSVGRYVDEIARRGRRLVWTADTHTHADYVSGSPELARRGATFFASRAAHLEITHQPLDGGDELVLGGVTVRALPTPGHTPDHIAYLLLDDRRPIAVFTGGSLMVGTVGRPDLLGAEHAEELAHAMWHSLHDQLLVLPDDLPVYPTHGAGSFCSAPGASARTTTIAREKATNPLLQVASEDEFVRRLLGELGSLPGYFSWLPAVNRRGLGPPPRPPLPKLAAEEVQRLVDNGAALVDVRAVDEFTRAHVPGSLSIALRPVFASWLGWLVRPERQLVFVADHCTDRTELVRQCTNIGYDRLAGELVDGVDGWGAAGLPLASLETVTADRLEGPVLDVRQTPEYRAGHVPGAHHVELGALAEAVAGFTGTVTVMCGHGERAATGASLLAAAGNTRVRVLLGGPDDWSAATGHRLEQSE